MPKRAHRNSEPIFKWAKDSENIGWLCSVLCGQELEDEYFLVKYELLISTNIRSRTQNTHFPKFRVLEVRARDVFASRFEELSLPVILHPGSPKTVQYQRSTVDFCVIFVGKYMDQLC